MLDITGKRGIIDKVEIAGPLNRHREAEKELKVNNTEGRFKIIGLTEKS